ncbi:MAG TPA: hypothetical protein VFI53_17660, partial [Myxococcaceae bacterium]|nr:hypothetical protein [Myxococcaceae bacterium]
MKAPVQTPGMWLRAGGSGLSKARCRAALIACGLNPDEFGSYKDVQESQSEARKDLRIKARQARAKAEGGRDVRHCSPCTIKSGQDLNAGHCLCQESEYAQDKAKSDYDFIHANGQSGHMAMDSLF